jgi:serpin B
MSDAPGPDDAFGAALYRLLAADGGNLVFSPASIGAALRMALCGARGRTAAEIAAALGLPGLPAGAGGPQAGAGEPQAGPGGPQAGPGGPQAGAGGPQAGADGLRLLSRALADLPGDDIIVRGPNTMWVQSGLPVQPEFTAALRGAAAVSIRDADFTRAADAARREINDLIGKQTEGKITDLLPPGTIDALTRLVLANAIYLKAAWAYPFPEPATADAPFYPQGPGTGSPVTVRMMRLAENLRYLREDGYQAVLLPYRGGRLAMTIMLPDGPPGPPPADLAARLGALTRRGTSRRVRLALPRFRQEGEFGLIPALQQLGIRQAFQPGRADFTGITTAEPLCVSAVMHKAYIDVDEHGTEAAAATAVTVRMVAAVTPAAPPVTMTVDHPFLFAITDTSTGLLLFLGRVTRP